VHVRSVADRGQQHYYDRVAQSRIGFDACCHRNAIETRHLMVEEREMVGVAILKGRSQGS
jgi:hypothetical protein